MTVKNLHPYSGCSRRNTFCSGKKNPFAAKEEEQGWGGLESREEVEAGNKPQGERERELLLTYDFTFHGAGILDVLVHDALVTQGSEGQERSRAQNSQCQQEKSQPWRERRAKRRLGQPRTESPKEARPGAGWGAALVAELWPRGAGWGSGQKVAGCPAVETFKQRLPGIECRELHTRASEPPATPPGSHSDKAKSQLSQRIKHL